MFQQVFHSIRQTVIRTVLGGTLMAGVLEVTTHLPTQGRRSEWYHWMADEWGTPLLRRVLDPEDAHHMAIEIAKHGWIPLHHPSALEQRLDNLKLTLFSSTVPPNEKEKDENQKEDDDQDENLEEEEEEGKENASYNDATASSSLLFSNPIGLAAGFDKDGEIIQPLLDLGFGFVEIGSVTLQPQPGNPKPRMFRYTADQAIINRYGFNSLGANKVQESLQEFYTQINNTSHNNNSSSWLSYLLTLLPWKTSSSQPRKGIIGINLGKNKTSTTPIEDYQQLIQQLGPYADYLVINVSSPNTPGLRDLQETKSLQELLLACIQTRNQLTKRKKNDNNKEQHRPPLLVKLAPDLTDNELQDIATVLLQVQIDGIILTNTTNQRPASFLALASSNNNNKYEIGGLSGRPLRDLSTERIRSMYEYTNGEIPIIGVGGIFTAHDIYEKVKAGASIIQIYSSLVYEGPGLVSKLRHDLSKLLSDQGHSHIEDVIGLDHSDIHWRKQQEKRQREQQRTNRTGLPSKINS